MYTPEANKSKTLRSGDNFLSISIFLVFLHFRVGHHLNFCGGDGSELGKVFTENVICDGVVKVFHV